MEVVKPRNRVTIAPREAVVGLKLTPQELEMLTDLVATGFYGADVAECAERLIAERLREIVPDRK